MQSLDDDFSFDSSVWGVPAPAPSLLSPPPPPSVSSSSPTASHNQFDDFDDFHTPLESKTPSLAHDDDFGDFGDFGEVGGSDVNFAFEDTTFSEEIHGPESQLSWTSLRLFPLPSPQDLSLQIEEILGPVWPHKLSSLTRDEDIRQVEGIGQILTNSTSRELYSSLLDSPPLMEPISWIRSRIRQQHLIALGLPVNLDEILPQATVKPLPPLHISTRPVSAPPGAANGPSSMPPSRSNSRAGTRSNTPQPSARSGPSTVKQLTLGRKPELDAKKIDDLLKLDTDQLNLLPLAKLDKYLADLRIETTNTSSLLTYLLQTRDALQQDSETYNRLIAELVSEAQKTKSGKSRVGVKRSGTLS
ncbi:hypothetical protein EV363DRAFT_530829 [Boletus edulis]|uniref:Uncharacterized protein n=1 Tax=Boletus edulis BED1 TaxID=1328754 RepID=A0AAD4C6D9_BOLED|nr:hypothetical protein EV363DRAFT_530829 [Boletus edulis]KAF8450490.1 hypothetical protein L210DRAFT_2393165 [Boletus edulis BED1]